MDYVGGADEGVQSVDFVEEFFDAVRTRDFFFDADLVVYAHFVDEAGHVGVELHFAFGYGFVVEVTYGVRRRVGDYFVGVFCYMDV